MFWSCFSLLWDTGYAQQWHKHTQAPNNGEITTQNTSYTPAKMCPSHIHFCPYTFKGHIQWAGSLKKKKEHLYADKHTQIYSPAILKACYSERHLGIWSIHTSIKLKQGGQKYIFQFSRCESFHLVIQMSLVFCVNRCPYPASFISISWLGFSMQLAVPLPHRY